MVTKVAQKLLGPPGLVPAPPKTIRERIGYWKQDKIFRFLERHFAKHGIPEGEWYQYANDPRFEGVKRRLTIEAVEVPDGDPITLYQTTGDNQSASWIQSSSNNQERPGHQAARYFGAIFGTKPQRDLAVRLMNARIDIQENAPERGVVRRTYADALPPTDWDYLDSGVDPSLNG